MIADLKPYAGTRSQGCRGSGRCRGPGVRSIKTVLRGKPPL